MIFKSEQFKFIGQNSKFDMKWLRKKFGIEMTNLKFDTMVAHYLMVGKFIPHGLKMCAWKYTDYGGYGLDRGDMMEHPYEEILEYNAMDVFITMELKKQFEKELDELQLDLLCNILSPAQQGIGEMELEGTKLDKKNLEEATDRYVAEVTALETKLHEYPIIQQMEKSSDKIINFQSTQQLARVLGLMNIDTGKRTKKTKAMCTNKDALGNVKHKHGLVKDIIELRGKNKVLGTYLKPYVEKERFGRIHADYSFITTATGRLSSFNPNFQNIPYDTRQVFVSANGYFLELDYSQLELRVLGMLSGDKALIKAFQDGEDIHEATRMFMFGDNSGESDAVKTRQRVDAKSVNFSVIYKTTAMGLAKDLNRPIRECQRWIDDYYKKHTLVKLYQELVIEHVQKYGYIDTPFGRRRYFDVERAKRSKGAWNAMEREAVNMPIQSTASDIVMKALSLIYMEMRKRDYKSRLVWEVHDSIGLDCFEDEILELSPMTREIGQGIKYDWMRGIPLVIDQSIGTHWGKLDKIK
jgi:DNA polymerase-1